ncbi:MAG: hypothetical protein JOS17DRAFT_571402 [Linnemannia elongata]|nr:MAG: hypothetical protein JOS17DRAFT_571402 [Linnemannia elongata]
MYLVRLLPLLFFLPRFGVYLQARYVQCVTGGWYKLWYKGVGTEYATKEWWVQTMLPTEKGGERCKCERATCHFFFDLVVVGVVEVEFSGSGVRVVVILRAVVFGVVRAEEVSGADCLVVIVLAVLVGEMVVVDDFH